MIFYDWSKRVHKAKRQARVSWMEVLRADSIRVNGAAVLGPAPSDIVCTVIENGSESSLRPTRCWSSAWSGEVSPSLSGCSSRADRPCYSLATPPSRPLLGLISVVPPRGLGSDEPLANILGNELRWSLAGIAEPAATR